MYYVYVLRSLATGDLYFDYTDDMEKGLEDHLEGKNEKTRDHLPVKLVYYETYPDQDKAVARMQELDSSEEAKADLALRLADKIDKCDA